MLAMSHEEKRRKKSTTTYGKAHRRRGPAYLITDDAFPTEIQTPAPATPRSSYLSNVKGAKLGSSIGDKPPTPPKDIYDFDSEAEKTPPLLKPSATKRKSSEPEPPAVKRRYGKKPKELDADKPTVTAVRSVRAGVVKEATLEREPEKKSLVETTIAKKVRVYGKPKGQHKNVGNDRIPTLPVAQNTSQRTVAEKHGISYSKPPKSDTLGNSRRTKTPEVLEKVCNAPDIGLDPSYSINTVGLSKEAAPTTPSPLRTTALSLLVSSEVKRSSNSGNKSTTPVSGRGDGRKIGRKRLIDSLTAHAAGRADGESDQDDDTEGADERSSNITEIKRASPPASLVRQSSQTMGTTLASAIAPAPGVRITYSRQRSMLSEQNDLLDVESGAAERRNIASILQMRQDLDAEVTADAGKTAPAIRSVHELRQAGATKRFLDEIDDLGDRICESGKSSSRRSGLLELLTKMHEKSFLQNLLTTGIHERVIKTCWDETDMISSFLVGGVITVLLSSNAKVPAYILRSPKLLGLLTRMLEVGAGINSLAKQRKANMSAVAVSKLGEEQTRLQSLPLWLEKAPGVLSPRIIALASISLMVRTESYLTATSSRFANETLPAIFNLLDAYSHLDPQILQSDKSAELYLVLTIISTSYIVLMANDSGSQWGPEYLTGIQSIACIVLQDSTKQLASLRPLVLSLVLNITNGNKHSHAIFTSSDFLPLLMREIVSSYRDSKAALGEDGRMSHIDSLVLMLGIMINLAEQMNDGQSKIIEERSLRDLLQIFSVTAEKAAEADSVEDTHLNVTVGYLAVFLGYLALLKPLAGLVRAGLPGGTLRPLIMAIEEFIRHHKMVDAMSGEDAQRSSAHAGLTQRLTLMLTRAREVESGFGQ